MKVLLVKKRQSLFVIAAMGFAWVLRVETAHAIDFKIDVPVRPPSVSESLSELERLLIIPELPKALRDSSQQDISADVEVAVTVQSQKLPTPVQKKQVSTIYETNEFPVSECLEPNVSFWKKIYREIDTDEALIHDKDDLSRIFGRLSLPKSLKLRKQTISSSKAYMQEQLTRLAKKLKNNQNLTDDDFALLSVFNEEDRLPARILESASRLRIQTGLRTRFDGGVQRSLALLPTISGILNSYDVPRDIVHLPHVESSYVSNAHSKVGAVGLWQLMPGTMRLLKGRAAVKRRTELVISTQAAAKLLQQNFRMLGSWPLALTAYNHGPGGVRRAIAKTGSKDLCTIIERYQSPSFKFASSNFYAQFLAARHVALEKYSELSNSSTHGRMLKPLLAHAKRERL